MSIASIARPSPPPGGALYLPWAAGQQDGVLSLNQEALRLAEQEGMTVAGTARDLGLTLMAVTPDPPAAS